MTRRTDKLGDWWFLGQPGDRRPDHDSLRTFDTYCDLFQSEDVQAVGNPQLKQVLKGTLPLVTRGDTLPQTPVAPVLAVKLAKPRSRLNLFWCSTKADPIIAAANLPTKTGNILDPGTAFVQVRLGPYAMAQEFAGSTAIVTMPTVEDFGQIITVSGIPFSYFEIWGGIDAAGVGQQPQLVTFRAFCEQFGQGATISNGAGAAISQPAIWYGEDSVFGW